MSTTTIDHDEIRKWVESKGGKPATVERTHDDESVGIIRLMFPKSPQSEHGALTEISWDEFFEQFEAGNLALFYDEKTLFNKLIGRETAEKREHGDHSSRHHPAHEQPEKHAATAKHETKHAKHETKHAKHETKHERAKTSDSDDLKSREYRDAEGQYPPPHPVARRVSEQQKVAADRPVRHCLPKAKQSTPPGGYLPRGRMDCFTQLAVTHSGLKRVVRPRPPPHPAT